MNASKLSGVGVLVLALVAAMGSSYGSPAGVTPSAALAGDTAPTAALRLRDAVVRVDKPVFTAFFAEPSDVHEEDFADYFGEPNRPSALREFLSKPGVRMHAFYGTDEQGHRTSTIVYYDAGSVREPAKLDWHAIGDAWLTRYAAIELVLVEGRWRFDGTPFFFFRHAPWAGDYG